MKKQLYGLRRAPVNQFLKQLKIDLATESNQLSRELEKIKEENRQLEQSIFERESKAPVLIDNEEIWELGKERIRNVLDFLEEKKEHELAELRKVFAERRLQMQKDINKLELEIQSIEKIITSMLNAAFIQHEHPAAIQQELINGEHEAAATQERIEPASVEAQPDEVPSSSPVKNSESFWGDLEGWTSSAFTALPKEPIFVPAAQIDQAFNVMPEASRPVEEVKEKPIEKASANANVQSDVLMEQIDSIKTQYIVGKVAGEDLYDLKGQLIVARNSIITKEAVERANQSGKLADLIVNMMLSGGGAE